MALPSVLGVEVGVGVGSTVAVTVGVGVGVAVGVGVTVGVAVAVGVAVGVTVAPAPYSTTSCGRWLGSVPSRASKTAPSVVCGSSTKPTAPLPVTTLVTSYAAQVLPVSLPRSATAGKGGAGTGAGRVFQVMAVSLQVTSVVVRSSGPSTVPPFACTHRRNVARCTAPLTPLTSKRR